MPYKPDQVKAIAAQMKRDGKSDEEVRAFFHKHGHGGDSKRKLAGRLRKR